VSRGLPVCAHLVSEVLGPRKPVAQVAGFRLLREERERGGGEREVTNKGPCVKGKSVRTATGHEKNGALVMARKGGGARDSPSAREDSFKHMPHLRKFKHSAEGIGARRDACKHGRIGGRQLGCCSPCCNCSCRCTCCYSSCSRTSACTSARQHTHTRQG
jgi:hypothetical protein